MEWLADELAATAAEVAERQGLRLVGLPTWWMEFSSEMAAVNERCLIYESATEPVDG